MSNKNKNKPKNEKEAVVRARPKLPFEMPKILCRM